MFQGDAAGGQTSDGSNAAAEKADKVSAAEGLHIIMTKWVW